MKSLGVLFLFFLCLSCSRHEPVGEEDQFRRIQTRIDQKDYEKAEGELREILNAEPGNQRARVILASLYVNKAGITLKDYFALEKLSHLSEGPPPPVLDLGEFEKADLPEDSDFKKSLRFLSEINSAGARAQEISEKFEQVPVVTDEGAEDLRRALQEMDAVAELTDGNALYRGVIKFYLFKYLWKTGSFLQFGEGRLCSQEVTKLSNRLLSTGDFALGMLDDVSRGFPESRQRFQEQIRLLQQEFKKAQASLMALKSPGRRLKEITEKQAQEQGIGNFTCDF